MNGKDAPGSIRDPSVSPVEAFGALIANQDPQACLGEVLTTEVFAGSRVERSADAKTPTRRIDIQAVQFPAPVPVSAPRGTGRREPADHSFIHGDDGRGLKRVGRAERVSLGAVFGSEGVEILVGHETSIGDLPRAHMNARDLRGVIGRRGAEQHAASFAAGNFHPTRISGPATSRVLSSARMTWCDGVSFSGW